MPLDMFFFFCLLTSRLTSHLRETHPSRVFFFFPPGVTLCVLFVGAFECVEEACFFCVCVCSTKDGALDPLGLDFFFFRVFPGCVVSADCAPSLEQETVTFWQEASNCCRIVTSKISRG